MSESILFSSKVVWFFIFIALYWAFCIFWGVKCAQRAVSASDLFVAGRALPVWAFVMGVTATSFAGWTFVGQPALLLRDGFQVNYASFVAIVIPLAGILFFKRQWILGKRFGYVTPGEMYAAYFRDDVVRIFTAGLAVLFAIPFLGLLLGASGFLVSIVTDGWLSRTEAMWVLAVVLLIYVAAGNIRAVAYVGTLQTLLIIAGTIILGAAALDIVGGFQALNAALAEIAATPAGKWGTTRGYGGGDFNALFATPGVLQWTDGLGKEAPVGGLWTGVMVLTFLLAFMGLPASPAFSLWAFSASDPKPFAPQQLWASACAIGLILFFFVTFQGIAGLLLGGSSEVREAGLAVANVLPALENSEQGRLVGELINVVGETSPWLVGLLTVCALAAIKSSAGIYMASAGAIVARDIYKRFFNPSANDRQQKLCSRVTILITTGLALLMATFAREGVMLLGTLALSLSLQLWPALMAVTWFPWLTRRGVTTGLIAGTIVVVLTDALGQRIAGDALPWGQWPWTIHAAGWGLAANLVIAFIGSAMIRDEGEAEHRMSFHRFLREHAGLPATKRRVVSAAWILSLAWIFFSIGPGIVIGNYLFGAPGTGTAGWDFGMPSIWAWQLLWWGLGILLIWFLAYKMELSTVPHGEVRPVAPDVAATSATMGMERSSKG